MRAKWTARRSSGGLVVVVRIVAKLLEPTVEVLHEASAMAILVEQALSFLIACGNDAALPAARRGS